MPRRFRSLVSGFSPAGHLALALALGVALPACKGKGKSTAAFGLVLRSLGHGHRVAVVQFVKGAWETGERAALDKFGEFVTIATIGFRCTNEASLSSASATR